MCIYESGYSSVSLSFRKAPASTAFELQGPDLSFVYYLYALYVLPKIPDDKQNSPVILSWAYIIIF